MTRKLPIVAVDIGNSRIKFGLFDRPAPRQPPWPRSHLVLASDAWSGSAISNWLTNNDVAEIDWCISSVRSELDEKLLRWIDERDREDLIQILSAVVVPIKIDLPQPDRVGVDRLTAAVAANSCRDPERPAIVVDAGSAITVDLISEDGVFRGGAILPGARLSARVLHSMTDQLPLTKLGSFTQPPDALGRSTEAAIQSGLYWGAIGAVETLVTQLIKSVVDDDDEDEIEVFVTGGAGEWLAGALNRPAEWMPHLTLSGIALSAAE